METILYVSAIWYAVGLAICVLGVYLDWRNGIDFHLGTLLCLFVCAVMGPMLIIPVLEQVTWSWSFPEITLLKGKGK